MTDHKKEAERSLSIGTFGSTEEDFALRSGLIHATLYLAEQQRIANLIAYLGDDTPTLEMDVQIRAGLGLA